MEDDLELQLIRRLLAMVEANEWRTHNAAENSYCPYCNRPDQHYSEQLDHNPGCVYVNTVGAAKLYLTSVDSEPLLQPLLQPGVEHG